jgi:predicted CXXCH cytochrome family protein
MNVNDFTAEKYHRFRYTVWPKIRWVLWRAMAVGGVFVIILLFLAATASWYTSRPQFCRSCHIMEPYFVSWEHSNHKDVACVKCHFPPGFGEKVWGKTLGMVQLAKYVTQTQGSRPSAEVSDASCLRSGCHETRLLSGRVDFHGIPFDHEPHLKDLKRGKKLRCTSCHSQIVQGAHMSVTASTCFLCHFKGTLFNEGTGACTRCHQIPDEEFELGGGVTFNHNLAYEKGVDCINCHGDLIRGDGEVPPERCQVCHNRTDDLARVGESEFLHRKHVTEHKVDCLDCHLTIEHSLDREKIVHAAGDCTACHPDHHHEQVNMLRGVGGRSVPDLQGGMLVTRVECRSCHRVKEVSATGTVLWRASADVCIDCHDASAADRLRSYHQTLKDLLAEIESAVGRCREALKSAELEADKHDAIGQQLDEIQHDLDFLSAANGVHNIHYASTLTRALLEKLTRLCGELKIEAPQGKFPETMHFESGDTGTPESEDADRERVEGSSERNLATR